MVLQVCPSVLSTGACMNNDCSLNHLVKFCEPCGFVCSSEHAYERHVHELKHTEKLKESPVNLRCTTCSRNILAHQWSDHVSKTAHRSASERLGVSPDIQPVEGEPPPGQIHCAICNINVKVWATHEGGKKHKKKADYYALKAVLDEAQSDKNDVTMLPKEVLDFGIIELPDARRGVEGHLSLQVSNLPAQVQIVNVMLSTNMRKRKKSGFSILPWPNTVLAHGVGNSITLRFRQQNRGRYEGIVEIMFVDLASKENFIIVRPVLAIIGNKDDHEALKPVSPYVPPKGSSRDIKQVVPGVAPPKSKVIPWVVSLPQAKIPNNLTTALNSQKAAPADTIKGLQGKLLPLMLESTTYTAYFKALLWIEERRLEEDLTIYDISSTKLRLDKNHYFLKVPGLAEKRPSVLVGDSILVRLAGDLHGKWFEGFVYLVEQQEVGLRFGRSFKQQDSGQRYHVRFRLNRLPFRRQHQALESDFSVDRVLFPVLGRSTGLRRLIHKGQMHNQLIEGNPAQLLAVNSIVSQPPGAIPFIVFGPPGTGKTVTIIEAMLQLLRDPDIRIFACAPSNTAADVIALRLISYLGPKELFRFYAASQHLNQVPDSLKNYSFSKNGLFSVPDLKTMNGFRVVVSTCVSASVAHGIGMKRGHFKYIFVDEAGQATEPEVMIPIKTMADDTTNIVLSGDPRQLGPVIRCPVATELGLGLSFAERLMARDAYDEDQRGISIVKLVKNFRSHGAILSFPNDQFYDGELEVCGNPDIINFFDGSKFLPNPLFPVIFHAIEGEDLREGSSPSFFNIHEVTQVKSYVDELRVHGVADEDIGIITPYRAQASKIRQALKATRSTIKVASTEEYQGQERKVIIISTVRSSQEYLEFDSRHNLGFVTNPRRFNVAVTRAQALLIIVGDHFILGLDPLWQEFLNYIYNHDGWAGDDISWDPEAPVGENGEYGLGVQDAAYAEMRNSAGRIALTLGDVVAVQN